MADLKPCPFCGENRPKLVWEIDVCRIRCRNCGTSGLYEFSEDTAAEAWNRRAEDG